MSTSAADTPQDFEAKHGLTPVPHRLTEDTLATDPWADVRVEDPKGRSSANRRPETVQARAAKRQAQRAHGGLSEIQHAYIEWLLDPDRDPKTEREFAAQVGVAPRTLSHWKYKVPKFRDAWEKRANELNVSMARVQQVINALWKAATSPSPKHAHGDPAAMKLYLEYVGKYTPVQKRIVEDRSIKEMTIQELLDIADAE